MLHGECLHSYAVTTWYVLPFVFYSTKSLDVNHIAIVCNHLYRFLYANQSNHSAGYLSRALCNVILKYKNFFVAIYNLPKHRPKVTKIHRRKLNSEYLRANNPAIADEKNVIIRTPARVTISHFVNRDCWLNSCGETLGTVVSALAHKGCVFTEYWTIKISELKFVA